MEETAQKEKVKKKSNSKSVIIDGQIHALLKNYCKGNNRKLGLLIENLIKLYLAKPKDIENLFDNLKS